MSMILLIVLWAFIARNASRKNAWYDGWKRVDLGLFIVSVFGVIYTTILSRTIGTSEVCLIPFYSFVLARDQPELYRSMLMNVFLFVPFGAALSQVFPRGWTKRRKIVLALCAGMILSGFVEGMQYCFALGRAEIDDVLTNDLGAVVGCGGVELVGWLLDRRGKDLLHRIQTIQNYFKR